MSSERPPVRRSSSMEMTAVLPPEKLPPISTHNIDELGLDPDHPETRGLYERAAREELRERPTMVPCPAKCSPCPCCYGVGMTTKARSDEWRAEHPGLDGAS